MPTSNSETSTARIYLRLIFLTILLPVLASCQLDGPVASPVLEPTAAVSGLSVTNASGKPDASRLVLHDIGSTQSGLCCNATLASWKTLKVTDTGTLTLKNTGSKSLSVALKIANSSLFRLPKGEKLLTLSAGQSYALSVQFAPGSKLAKGVYRSELQLTSGSAVTAFPLTGMFMQYPEGGREIYLKQLVNDGFGYKINLGTNSQGGLSSSSRFSAKAGEEVRSSYWRIANTSQPLVVTQIAAFHSCCKSSMPLSIIPKGKTSALATMYHSPAYSQTIYPRSSSSSAFTSLSLTYTQPFEIRVSGYSSDPLKGIGNGNLGLRFWPMRTTTGVLVPNTYLLAMDYVQKGCGSTSNANCDYNDNVYILNNVKPSY